MKKGYGPFFYLLFLLAFPASLRADPPLTGYTLPLSLVSNDKDVRRLLLHAVKAGANVINVVPPARVWASPGTLRNLDLLVEEMRLANVRFVITRIDLPTILGPDGTRVIVGLKDYDRWMEEEIRFYAGRYGKAPHIMGFNVGPFSEPLLSRRGGLLRFDESTQRYEITQYSREMEAVWHQWLISHPKGGAGINPVYGTRYLSMKDVPMPKNEEDDRFDNSALAYANFVQAINDWMVERYETCRALWQENTGRTDVPFILELGAFDEDVFMRGRPAYARLDVRGWVSRADAVGISLIHFKGVPGQGRAAIEATVGLLKAARATGKDVFVLASGYEERVPVLNQKELIFLTRLAQSLTPRTFIYEFLQDPVSVKDMPGSGVLLNAKGESRKKVFDFVKGLMTGVREGKEFSEPKEDQSRPARSAPPKP